MSTPEDERFDEAAISLLNMDEEDAKALRVAVLDLNYETLFKPLWQRQSDYMKKTQRVYAILIVLLFISIAIQLKGRLW